MLTTYGLSYDRAAPSEQVGCYVGQAACFSDAVQFWNLRAAGLNLVFYDPAHGGRLDGLRDDQVELAISGGGREHLWRRVPVWHDPESTTPDLEAFGGSRYVTLKSVTPQVWRSRPTADATVPRPLDRRLRFAGPTIGRRRQVLGTVSGSDDQRRVLTFPLPDVPISDATSSVRQAMAVVFAVEGDDADEFTFRAPNLPRLNNQFEARYGIAMAPVRVEADGTALLLRTGRDSVSLFALAPRELISDVLSVAGIKATPSPAGLLGARLIRQMGGLWGCTAFRVPGVRALIEKYEPDRSFTRSGAHQMISGINEHNKQPQLGGFQYLNLGQKQNGKVKHEDLFVYLAERGVFRVGIEARCPHCELDFWTTLEDTRMMLQCVYCGRRFNSVAQLRDFRFRRSGLFGRRDSQGGGIPVALTLLRLLDSVEPRLLTYTTGTELATDGGFPKCETDFVVVSQTTDAEVVIAIGECKTHREITDDDISNMVRVASALEEVRLRTYIVFSKVGEFSGAEIERFKVADQAFPEPRVILLSARELEPESVYDRIPESAQIDMSGSDFLSLANVTRQLYLRVDS
jgi:hypothetical protein